MVYQIEDVINWLLSKKGMTPKKLQKMLYYAYAWYLTLQNERRNELTNRLFNARFEAWVHGPVIPEVYQMYRDLRFAEIPQYSGPLAEFDEDTIDVLNQVYSIYGGYTGNQLESISHQEIPWINARQGYQPLDRCNEEIRDEDMFDQYIQYVLDED
ncbi:SocA family protein [Paenibacillus rhizovicinus]|uniref:SocA family protein n=1 Tax=Paenibacillus rhizovicinus TaxID=2704463 RepID=A0A6C0P6J4_9BACL|nr:type II toxin-antitoxin system antitoxin SocA domain-containing protein [Paenibacillus rhizovicinus]QHW33323.1 SocA family protein [Paenibacillus rhizovicinus]